MKSYTAWILVLASCVLSTLGCGDVTVTKPLGTPWTLAETKKLETRWELNNDNKDSYLVQVVGPGDLRVGVIEWDNAKKTFVATTGEVHVTHIKEHDFIFMKSEEEVGDDKQPLFTFALMERLSKTEFLIRAPDRKLMAKAVQSSGLPGKVVFNEDGKGKEVESVHLSCNEGELLKAIEDIGLDQLFPKTMSKDQRMILRAVK